MCPYYDRDYNMCKIYKSLQSEYQKNTYCMEMGKDHTECANYKQCKNSYGGVMPPPYKF